MKRIAYATAILGMLLLPLAVATGGVEAQATDAPYIARYNWNPPSGSENYDKVQYRPRGWVSTASLGDARWPTATINDAGDYSGFDFFTAGYNAGTNLWAPSTDWFGFELRVQSTVVVVWRAGNPLNSTMSSGGWTSGDTVSSGTTVWPTYTKVVGPGWFWMNSVNHGAGSGIRDTPMLLIGDADGSAPDGTLPYANTDCPAGLHPTGYHRQIDDSAWCYFRHEHGADPANFHATWNRPFGEPGTKMGMVEPHVGFKTIVFDFPSFGSDPGKVYRWLLVPHLGTAGDGRICQSFHSLAVGLVDPATGAKLLDLYLVLDTGPMLENDTHVYVTHANCPNQGPAEFARAGPGPKRQIPDSVGTIGYEPWTFKTSGLVVPLGGVAVFNTIDGQTRCNQTTLCVLVPNAGNSGTNIFFQGSQFGIDLTNYQGPTGWFCTDPEGKAFTGMNAGGTCVGNGVKQFIDPSIVGKLVQTGANRAENWDGFGAIWIANSGANPGPVPSERENSIPNDATMPIEWPN